MPDQNGFMSATDAFSWYQEKDPSLRATIVAVVWLDRRPDWERLRARVESATHAIPRLRQRVEEVALPFTPPRWVPDDRFDLAWHLRRTAVATDGSSAAVLAMARAEAMTAFDHDHPLWTMTVVERLPAGRAALILKLHHSLTDGQGAMLLAPTLFDLRRTAPAPRTHRPRRSAAGPVLTAALGYHWKRTTGALTTSVRMLGPAGRRAVTNPVGASRDAIRLAASLTKTVAPVLESLSPVMRERGLTRELNLLTVDLADLARAAHTAGGTLNDAFLTAVTGGLRRYHQRHRSRVAELRVTMPVSIRSAADAAASNRITLMRFPLPVSEPQPRARMEQIHRACAAVRDAPSLPFTDLLAGGLDLLPTAVVAGMLKRVDFLASDVVGPTEPIYLAGAKVTTYGVFGPTMGSAANLTLISYAGRCFVGVNSDSLAVPDAGALLRCLGEGFDEVLALGGAHKAVRLDVEQQAVPTTSTAPTAAAGGRVRRGRGR